MYDFNTIETKSFKELKESLEALKEDDGHRWVFRGQYCDWGLRTSFERAMEKWDLKLKKWGTKIEQQMVRDFKRYYDGEDREQVQNDTLYCLSLMQHHGAPTRLLDWTYSKHVAIFNAIECAFNNAKKRKPKNCAVWCLNTIWCNKETQKSIENQMRFNGKTVEQAKIDSKKFMNERGYDEIRINLPEAFDEFYMNDKTHYKFVLPENPFRFHRRLYIQQGLFLCLGDVTTGFEDNLRNLAGYENNNNLMKITCSMVPDDFQDALIQLWKMNMSSATLYPGLDGFAKSMTYKLGLYKILQEVKENKYF